MIIETERLRLRELVPEDFEAWHEILSDPETMQHYPEPFDEAKTKRWIKWNLDNYEEYGFGLWVVERKENGEFIGDCGMTMQDIDGEMLPEIGYHIHKKFWRQGYGSEAARAVRDWAFQNTDYDRLYSYMKYTNVGSYSTALSNGMKKVKEYPDEKNGISYAYAISRAEWEALIMSNAMKHFVHKLEEMEPIELEAVPYQPDESETHYEQYTFAHTLKDNAEWKTLVEKHIGTAKTFEIHCWEAEEEQINAALKYGQIKPMNWKYGTVIAGNVTEEFKQMLRNTEVTFVPDGGSRMTPFFSIFFDNGFSSEHYGAENYVRTSAEK